MRSFHSIIFFLKRGKFEMKLLILSFFLLFIYSFFFTCFFLLMFHEEILKISNIILIYLIFEKITLIFNAFNTFFRPSFSICGFLHLFQCFFHAPISFDIGKMLFMRRKNFFLLSL